MCDIGDHIRCITFGKSPALASSKLIENNSKAKLVEETCSNYIEMSKDENLKHIEKIDNMLSSLLANNVEIEEIEKVMNNYNVFLLKSEKVISSKNAISPNQ
jgi:predicted transcriptional regulator